MNTAKKILVSTIAALTVGVSSASFAAVVPQGTQLAPAAQQVFKRNINNEPSSLDPQKVEGNAGSPVVRDLFEGLTTLDPHGKVIPGTATDWSVSDDGLVYTFNLRKDAQWSNGDPVTASDFVFAFQRAVDPATGSKYAWFMELANIDNAKAIIDGKMPKSELGIKAVDDHTVQITLSNQVPFFPKLVAHYTMMPVPQKVVEKYGDAWTRPENMVSNGAYKLTEWVVNERIVAKRNPKYWNDKETVVNEVDYLPIISGNAALNRYKAGEIDLTGAPSEHLKNLQKTIPEQVKISPKIGTYYYDFNKNVKPFDDVRVRKALTYSINRDAITNYVLGGGQLPAYSFTPESVDGFTPPDLAWGKMTQKERDEKARALLNEAGFNKSHPLDIELLYNTNEGLKKIAIATSQMWKQALGSDVIHVTLKNQEWKTFLDTVHQGHFQVARAGWLGDYNEPSTMLTVWTSRNAQNYGKWSNNEYDDLITQALTTQDPAKRSEMYTHAEKIFADEMPAIPVYQYTSVRLIKPTVHGYAIDNPLGTMLARDLYITAK
ncbi:peptide ABC transporter substrate-binding protein [Sansalvadorimonas verongulae]|uniref:peptide ABC transporter substrate-binding protein n=1 Tax=Sansalvadorimonas verongulae TaxID=2172824 RepID=UPI0012BD1C90|nr:peptide ABC transporter substrate-binding protein [Sansalvadorimonas verongulae]MTI14432.1 peptide ABC transporter substrate-binding protein [Sansalvadorimonas verongulae]